MKSLRLLREMFGVTQQELIEASGVGRSAMSMYDSGQAFPSRGTCKRLDDAVLAIIEKRGLDAIKKMVAERIEQLPADHVPDPHAGPPGPELPPEIEATGTEG